MNHPPHENAAYFTEPELCEWNRLLWIVDENLKKCPWMKIQSLESLCKAVKEEGVELEQAILNHDTENILEELGDIFYVLMTLIRLLEKNHTAVGMSTILQGINDKIIHRKPWVFGDLKVETPEEAVAMWNQIKALRD